MSDNNKEYYIQPDEAGSVKISEEVVASIAALTAVDVDGVSSLSTGIASDIAGLLGKKSLARGVKILFVEDSVEVEMFIHVKYGYVIPEVAKKVQDNVSNSIESMTGLKVTAVNIHVNGITFDKDIKKTTAEPIK